MGTHGAASPKVPIRARAKHDSCRSQLHDQVTVLLAAQRNVFIRQAICNVQAPAEPGAPLPALSFFGGFRTTAPVLVASSEMGRHPKPVTKPVAPTTRRRPYRSRSQDQSPATLTCPRYGSFIDIEEQYLGPTMGKHVRPRMNRLSCVRVLR
jgi:hypothetical protein